jgi:hypothetical protein
MAKFSIRESIRYAFITYAQHFFLLTAVGMTIGFAGWAGVVGPRLLAQKLGVYRPLTIKYHQPERLPQANSTGMSAALQEFSRGAGTAIAHKVVEHIKNTPLVYLLIILALWLTVWLLSIFLHLGFIQIMLDIRIHKMSSYIRLFSGGPHFFSYLGASILFGLLIFAIGIGAIVGGSALGALVSSIFYALGLVSTKFGLWFIAMICVLMSFIAFLSIVVRYLFFGYCLIDNDYSSRQALSASRRITHGSLQKLILFFVSISTIIYGLLSLVALLTGYSIFKGVIELTLLNFIHVLIISALGGPIFALALVYVYKRLAD